MIEVSRTKFVTIKTLTLGTEMFLVTSVMFNQLTLLVARDDFVFCMLLIFRFSQWLINSNVSVLVLLRCVDIGNVSDVSKLCASSVTLRL
jgi:hypothetical protein